MAIGAGSLSKPAFVVNRDAFGQSWRRVLACAGQDEYWNVRSTGRNALSRWLALRWFLERCIAARNTIF